MGVYLLLSLSIFHLTDGDDERGNISSAQLAQNL